jgi:Protein of unknown function (DUF3800)
MLVFIDESGDPGFKLARGSTAVFVAVLVAFKDVAQAQACQAAIDAVAVRLRIGGEFKFSGSRPEVRDAFFRAVLKFDFRVRAIVVKKERIYSAKLRSDKEAFYSFFVKSMLKFDDGLLKNATVVIDGSGDRSFKRELGSYLRRHLGAGRIKVIRFSNSASDRLVQLADMCTGAIARSYRADRTDATQWRKMLEPKIDDVWPFK